MAKDDMNLIIYKILSYLYECNRKGISPTFTDMFNVLECTNIPLSYLGQILNELIDENYIKGVLITFTKSGTIITVTDTARITTKGFDYLNDNNKMKQAAEVAGEAFKFLLSTIITAAIQMPR